MNLLKNFGVSLMLGVATLSLAYADNNNNPSQDGPYSTNAVEYRFAAQQDPTILDDRKTEIWASVVYPSAIASFESALPVVVFLHGNHGTCGYGSNPRYDSSCQYTTTGVCPSGYVPTPNHLGYQYITKQLASWGYFVVSINANRGITCGSGVSGDDGLNLARGRLILRHLELMYQWANQGGAPDSLGLGTDGLIGKLDFTNVGLFGHSRGGEGVRAAYNLYLDENSVWRHKIPGLAVKAIYEVGAVDGQTSRVLDAKGTVWNQLLPMCDGDVSNLQGMNPYERMMLHKKELPHAQKSLYAVWGANHNYFNTEWQRSDSSGCYAGKPIFDTTKSGSLLQQTIALSSVSAFFRSHLGNQATPAFNQQFNPLHELPGDLLAITQIDRAFTPSPGETEYEVIEHFDKPDGINSSGNPNIVSPSMKMQHYGMSPAGQRVGEITWASDHHIVPVFAAIITEDHQGKDWSDFATLDFRVSRSSSSKSLPLTDISVALIDPEGKVSKDVSIDQYGTVDGPGNRYSLVFKTIRIPLAAFADADLRRVHGVKFTFHQKEGNGSVFLAHIGVQRQWGFGSSKKPLHALLRASRALSSLAMTPALPFKSDAIQDERIVPRNKNRIVSVRHVKQSAAFSHVRNAPPQVEITLASDEAFAVTNSLPILQVGNKQFKLSRFGDMHHLNTMVFTVTEPEYKKLDKKAAVSIKNGKTWQFGNLSSF